MTNVEEVLTQTISDYREVIVLGQTCAVWITGVPDDAAEITTFEQAMEAIREAFRLGQERNDELNRIRATLRGIAEQMRDA